MAKDFSAKQIRVSQLIASGGINKKPHVGLVIYSASRGTDYAGTFPESILSDVGSDTFLFVSGSKGTRQVTTGDRAGGIAVFGGDVVVSGSTHALGVVNAPVGFSGSLTRLVDGRSYLAAGTNVTITSESNGQITIAAAAGGDPPGPTEAPRKQLPRRPPPPLPSASPPGCASNHASPASRGSSPTPWCFTRLTLVRTRARVSARSSV